MKKVAGIYKITNTLDGKIYIGSTVNLTRRWWSHKTKTSGGCVKLRAAMEKYGTAAFEIELIESVPVQQNHQQVLWEREQHYLDTMLPFDENGYNLMRTASNNHQQVGSHIHDHNRAVSQYDLSGGWIQDFESRKAAHEATGTLPSSIADCISGKKKSAGGFMWTNKSTRRQIKPYKANVQRPVVQLSKAGKVVAVYASGKEASEATGVTQTAISNCCHRKPKYNSAGGFVWRFDDTEM